MKNGTINSAVLTENLTRRIEEDVRAQRICGAAVAVSQHGHMLYSRAIGFQSPEQSQPLREDAIFRIASMTKPVTAVAVLIQAQRGKLNLEDPIGKYVPEFDGPILKTDGTPNNTPIQIWHLLTHTSGMEADADTKQMVRNVPKEYNATLADAMAYYCRIPICFEPGTKRRYSGRATFDILARIVELTSGVPFETFVEQEIFAPCGMVDTTFAPTASQWERMVGMHDYRDGCAVWAETTPGCVVDNIPVTHPLGGAGLISTLDDYMKFGQMLLRKGMTPKGPVVAADWLAKMSQPQLAPELMKPDVNQGLGVRVITGDGYPWLSVGSFGWSGAYGTHFWVDPANEIVAVYMKNSRYDGGSGAVTGKHFEEDVFLSIL